MKPTTLALVSLLLLGLACKQAPDPEPGFAVADGLELTLWASEPDLVNPTNMAIDERGRVWVTEAINYRRHLKDEPDITDEGDRILILEDTNGDGRADKRTVFDQNIDIRSPLGINVLGNKVYIAQSPNLIVYTKDENDQIVDKKTLLTGFGGYDHDHGLHTVVYGFDGKLYFNMGDRTYDVTGPDGNHVVASPEGPYFAGSVFRMNEDGTDLEVLAHNFRNPYELAIDSYGTIWQTDNDDDGNEWTRLNYVMEGGNFGYWGPTGVRWREDRGTHFHHELPGVVPDIARTGPGSPTGLIHYEADLLPERYHGALIHAEPGKRHIYTFFTSPDGAGYEMEAEETVSSDDTNWRPSDITVAPDGSVFIADWHDPVVGGHNMLDIEQGRIYRLAPPDHLRPDEPALDLTSMEGLRAGLGSPNQSVRYHADQELMLRGDEALPMLEELWRGDDPVMRARALWLLGRIGGKGRSEIDEALESSDKDFRILGIRVARSVGRDPVEVVQPLLEDPNPQVRREAALALQHVESEAAAEALVTLAKGYDGEDRWYLEAWAIGARGKETMLRDKLREAFPGGFDPRLADFYWEIQPDGVLPYLSRAVRDDSLSVEDRLKALRAIAHRPEATAARTTAGFVGGASEEVAETAFAILSHQLFSEWKAFRDDPRVVSAVRQALGRQQLQADALALAEDLGDPAYGNALLAIARNASAPEENRAAALRALGQTRNPAYVPALAEMAREGSVELRSAAIAGLAAARPDDLAERMMTVLADPDAPNNVLSEAARALAQAPGGLSRILDLAERDELPAAVRTLAGSLVRRTDDEAILARADELLPPPTEKSGAAIPVSQPWRIANRIGDPEAGREVFHDTDGPKCANCHSLEPGEELAGPNLQAIGSKYDKRGLLDSILNPSAGISPEYYVYILDTVSQGMVIGVLAEDTEDSILVRNEFGDEIRVDPQEVVSRRRSNLSMMPEDIVNTMTEQELIDLLEFLSTLKADQATD